MIVSNNQLLVAGPCSAESRSQVLSVAKSVQSVIPDGIFRAGIWKPRTKPGSFEGVGTRGLQWLKEVKEQYKLKTATEVATPYHVEECLKHDVDVLWIGARSTGNPFSVQAIADSLKGTDKTVMIKNPMHTDLQLWIGAFERLEKAGIKNTVAIHRGFHGTAQSALRNEPEWNVLSDFRALMPNTKVICDASHIAGDSVLVPLIAQTAMKHQLDGLMIETHPNPTSALSDSKQQLTPQELETLLQFVFKPIQSLTSLRKEIDQTDNHLISLLAHRMNVSQKIALSKRHSKLEPLQPERWKAVQQNNRKLAHQYELDVQFVHKLYELIHQASINEQKRIV